MNNRTPQPAKKRRKKKSISQEIAQERINYAKKAAMKAAIRGTALPDFANTDRKPEEIAAFITTYHEWKNKPQDELDWRHGYKRGYDTAETLLKSNDIGALLSTQENGKQLYLNILDEKSELQRTKMKKSEHFLNGFKKSFRKYIENKSTENTIKPNLKRKFSEGSSNNAISNQPAQKRKRLSQKSSSTTLAFIAICPSITPDLTFENTQTVPGNSSPSLISNNFFAVHSAMDDKEINSNVLNNDENSNRNSFINKSF